MSSSPSSPRRPHRGLNGLRDSSPPPSLPARELTVLELVSHLHSLRRKHHQFDLDFVMAEEAEALRQEVRCWNQLASDREFLVVDALAAVQAIQDADTFDLSDEDRRELVAQMVHTLQISRADVPGLEHHAEPSPLAAGSKEDSATLVQNCCRELDLLNAEDLDEGALEELKRAFSRLCGEITPAKKKDSGGRRQKRVPSKVAVRQDPVETALAAVGTAPFEPCEFLRDALLGAGQVHEQRLSAALAVAVRGVRHATAAEWCEAYADVVPTGQAIFAELEDFRELDGASDVQGLAKMWSRLDTIIELTTVKAVVYPLPWRIASTIYSIRFARAWDDVQELDDPSTFKTEFHMASFLRQHDSVQVTTTEELAELLLVDANMKAKYKKFVQKQQKGITYRNRLLEAYSELGFMIILDPRWSEDAMEARNGVYHKAIRSLAKSLHQHVVHPLASLQVDVVQALLSLAQHTGTRWLAETVDEFVRDTAGCLVFLPWTRFRHPDDDEDARELLRGQFARMRSSCPNWSIAIPGVSTTGQGPALTSTPRVRENADAGPEPEAKRRRVE